MDKRHNIEDMYPLAPMQQGFLFHTLLTPASGIYTPQITLLLEGELDSAALQQAWHRTIARYGVLRTSFYWEQHDQPFQVVWRQVAVPWEQQDWRALSDHEQQARLQKFLQDDRATGFVLHAPPLMRLALLRRGDDQYQMIWSYHHLLLDGWSAGLVLQDVFSQYAAQQRSAESVLLPFPGRPYSDYIAWLRQQDDGAAQAFWQDYLKGFAQATDLPLLAPSPTLPAETVWDEQQRVLTVDDMMTLRAFAQQHQLTLNTCVQAAFGLLLSRYSDSTDVLFGATSSGRPPALPGVETMLGLFINTLPVRVRVDAATTVVAWLKQLQAERAAASAYEHTALMSIQACSELPAGEPLFKALLVFENYPVEASRLSRPASLHLKEVTVAEWTHFPLTLQVAAGDILMLTAKYNRAHIAPEAITRLLGHLRTLLTGMAARPQGRLRDIPMLSAAERQQFAQWNRTTVPYRLDRLLPACFEAQVDKTPAAIAVIAEDHCLTYHDLNTQANRLAHVLRGLGVGPEILVAVYMQRSPALLSTLLAILKAGGAYVPLDPAYPTERLAWILEDTQATVLLTDHVSGNNLFPLPPGLQMVNVEDQHDALNQQPICNPPLALTPDNSIYVIYTSGSTGRPKGAINTHRGVVNRLQWMQDAYALAVGDRVLHKTPLSFDVSVWEIFWPLLNGATVVLCPAGMHGDSAYLVDYIIRQQIDTLHFVPAMLDALLEAPGVANCHSLKRVMCSGEALSIGLQQRFCKTLSAAHLHNLYGPTEAAIDVTAWTCQTVTASHTPSVPIGYPIANTQIHLLDSQGLQVPIGIPGELHIGGVGLARGYLRRPDLTAAAFIPNAYGPPDVPTLYKTGDLARYRPDGAIEFLGRLDHQVKLRGFRIELGEIETLLGQHASVQQAVVSRREDVPGNPQLLAYVVPCTGNELTAAELDGLRQSLQRHLPDYMIPAAIVGLPELPLLPNGKINRRALPAPALAGVSADTCEALRTPTEAHLVTLWSDILQVKPVGIHDNFFALGGNSLIATRLTSRLRAGFNLDLPLRMVFEYPTIAALAARIDALHMALQHADHGATPGRKEITL